MKKFSEWKVGDQINHKLTKTIFESDNNLFSLLTMNHHPVHINIEYAKFAKHGKILVNGMLTLSLAVGITVPEISFNAIANLGFEYIKYQNPVFIGDTIHCISEILIKEITDHKSCGISWILTRVFNQEDAEVLLFEREILMKNE